MKLWIASKATVAYAILRRLSDAAVWNGSAWAVWSDGSYATYAVALTSGGGGLHSAAVPAAIDTTTDEVVADYYDRAGATAAATDTRLGSRAVDSLHDQIVKILAATYDSATADGSEITLSNGATQTVTASGRTTAEA